MTRIHNPPHPGETLREDVMPALGLTVTEAAAQLGVTRAALSRVLNGRAECACFKAVPSVRCCCRLARTSFQSVACMCRG